MKERAGDVSSENEMYKAAIFLFFFLKYVVPLKRFRQERGAIELLRQELLGRIDGQADNIRALQSSNAELKSSNAKLASSNTELLRQ